MINRKEKTRIRKFFKKNPNEVLRLKSHLKHYEKNIEGFPQYKVSSEEIGRRTSNLKGLLKLIKEI
tara:strand:+ start:2818 stop:3015 length:198 start_codon:yes stop_codon:yes gene_type:complete